MPLNFTVFANIAKPSGSCAFSSLLLVALLPVVAAVQWIANSVARLVTCCRCCCKKETQSKEPSSGVISSRHIARSCVSAASVLSSNAVIACSVMQLPLCSAARRAHVLLCNHAQQLVAVGATAGAIMSCGRICVALLTAAATIAFFYFRTVHDRVMPGWVIANTTQGFPAAAIAACAAIGYIVASAVFAALAITVDTLFLCVCDELESPRERVFMHRQLAALLKQNRHAASHAADAKAKALSPGAGSKDV